MDIYAREYWCPLRPEVSRFLWSWSYRRLWTARSGSWEPNSRPLQEKSHSETLVFKTETNTFIIIPSGILKSHLFAWFLFFLSLFLQRSHAGEMNQCFRALTLLQNTQVPFPAPTWWLTTTSNYSFRGSRALIWPLPALHTRGADIHSGKTLITHKIKINKLESEMCL